MKIVFAPLPPMIVLSPDPPGVTTPFTVGPVIVLSPKYCGSVE